jgi:hypothetical protein
MQVFAKSADFRAFASGASNIAVPAFLLQIRPSRLFVWKPFEEVIRAYRSIWAVFANKPAPFFLKPMLFTINFEVPELRVNLGVFVNFFLKIAEKSQMLNKRAAKRAFMHRKAECYLIL